MDILKIVIFLLTNLSRKNSPQNENQTMRRFITAKINCKTTLLKKIEDKKLVAYCIAGNEVSFGDVSTDKSKVERILKEAIDAEFEMCHLTAIKMSIIADNLL